MKKKIVVIGSSNTDLIAQVKRFPKAGETIRGLSYMQAMGGKGANQAVAAHRLGGEVSFITCLGDDPNGKATLQYYKDENLDTSSSRIVKDIASGTAIILVEESGENCIVVTPGANHMLSSDHLSKVKDAIIQADMVLAQLEIPYETIKAISEICVTHKIPFYLNVAPASQLDQDLIEKVDVLIVNETEAETITGLSFSRMGVEKIAWKLLEMGSMSVVITMGEKGSYYQDRNSVHQCPAYQVEVLDTTGAGDIFCGAFAAEISRGKDIPKALQFASAASALCVTKIGAQPSIPTELEVRKFLLEHR